MRKKKLNSFLRYILLLVILAVFIMLGFLRDQYILNFTNPDFPLLINRYESTLAEKVSGPVADPRWFTLPLYLLLYMGLTAATIWAIFKRKDVLAFTAIGYGLLLSLTASLFLLSKLSILPEVSYTIAQQLKELMLSPFLALLLIALNYAFTEKNITK